MEALKKVQETVEKEQVDLLSVLYPPLETLTFQVGKNPEAISTAANRITAEIKSQAQVLTESTTDQLGLTDSVLSQLHLTHSAAVEFLRQFWITYLSSPSRSSARKKELGSLAASLKRGLERMEAVQAYAVKEGGEETGKTVRGVLSSVKGSIDKALRLWERGQ
jgi:type IV secretory pathway TraG/TraD family ATPase VirD4